MGWIESEEDLDIFTDNEFSTVATTADGAEISGQFDLNFEPMFDQYGQSDDAEGRNITFLTQTSLIDNLSHRDRLTIKSKNYLIVGINPIDDGKLTSLKLKEDFA